MNTQRLAVTLILLTALVVSPEMVQAQVFDSGPSDPALFTTVINLPPDPDIGPGQFISGSTQLNVSDGGGVGVGFDANSGSEVNISGGSVGFGFSARDGSEVNISGGFIGFRFGAAEGSVVNISGGNVGQSFGANEGSEVNISGGALGCGFDAKPGSVVQLFGGEFRLNGDAFTDQTITLAKDDVFTGTLADGSSFIFADLEFQGFDNLSGVRLSAAPLPAFNATPVVTDSPVTEGPSGLRAGQTLTLVDGGSLRRDFAVVDATLNVQGGTLGQGAEAAGGVVNISGGVVGDFFEAYSGSEVNISGGVVGAGRESFAVALSAGSGCVVNVSGGLVGGIEAESGSVVNVSGGTVDIGLQFAASSAGLIAESGSEVNISGGTVTGIGFIARDGSAVNITGTQFLLNGELLDALVLDESFTIAEPVETISGILADGSPFNFGEVEFGYTGNLSPDATITVTLVSPVILGDVNRDEVVDFLDISPFIQVLATGGDQAEADCNQDGVVDFLDVSVFINILSST